MTDERTPAQGEWEGAIEAVIAAARNMPRSTTKAGCASDEHEYKIGSWAVWALDRALKQLDAIRALRPAARAVGDYVLVPREPTREMQKAYFDSIDRHMIRVENDVTFGRHENMRLAYIAMLSAAPPAQEATTEVVERDARQRTVSEWCAAAFGADQASSVQQRGIRMLEEAIEAYQACACDAGMAHKMVDYIFARPAGTLHQELGGIGVTVLALAAAANMSADQAEAKEVARVLSKPLEHFTKRNQVKNDAGFAALSALAAGRTEG